MIRQVLTTIIHFSIQTMVEVQHGYKELPDLVSLVQPCASGPLQSDPRDQHHTHATIPGCTLSYSPTSQAHELADGSAWGSVAATGVAASHCEDVVEMVPQVRDTGRVGSQYLLQYYDVGVV